MRADFQAWAWYALTHLIMFNYFQPDPRTWSSRMVVLVYGFLVRQPAACRIKRWVAKPAL
jgi:hypothetical protein